MEMREGWGGGEASTRPNDLLESAFVRSAATGAKSQATVAFREGLIWCVLHVIVEALATTSKCKVSYSQRSARI